MREAPVDRAYELVIGFRSAQLVHAAVELRIPDLVAAGPRSFTELAVDTGIDAGRLRRALRGLAALGVLEEAADGRFTNTPVGELFRRQALGGFARQRMMLLPDEYRAWEHLLETLRSGRTGYEIAFGAGHWESLERDSAQAARFNEAMVVQTENVSGFVASELNLTRVSLIVDVGGGSGALAAGVLLAHPDISGIVCDLRAGLAGTASYLDRLGVLNRCELVEADFFKAVPEGGDVYLLKQIIHDWDDDHAARILATCRRAMAPGSRIVLIERVFPTRVTEDPTHLTLAMLDLHMMVALGGRERTLEEYREMLERAGFRFSRLIPGDRFGLIEAVAD
jgi:orsellinic acid C2-O-methyltransferase